MINVANFIFRFRLPLLILLSVITIFLGYQASRLEVATDFAGMIPNEHEYIMNYQPFKGIFGGGNKLKIAVSSKKGDILTPDFLKLMRQINEDVMFVKGVDRLTVRSMVSPATRYFTVNELGFEAGRVVPEIIPKTDEGMARIKKNIGLAALRGRLVGMNMKSAMITADIYETGVDYLYVYRQLNEIREKYSDDDISIHISGFAMVVGFVTDALPKILTMFGITCIITIFILWRCFGNFGCAVLPLLSGGLSVLWGLGISRLIGMELDPMTTIVPFLVFSVGASHGIQMVKRYLEECESHVEGYNAALHALAGLMAPGVVALVTDAIGFFTIVMVPIGMIQDLAITASIGIACIIVANILGLTLVLSFFSNQLAVSPALSKKKSASLVLRILTALSRLTHGKNAYKILAISVVLFLIGFFSARTMQVGDVNPGEPLLWEDSVYNRDVAKMMEDFLLGGVDSLSVVVSGETDGTCKNQDVLDVMVDYEWEMWHLPGVVAVISSIVLVERLNEMMHEGDVRWRTLPKDRLLLASLMSMSGSNSDTEFTDMGCKNMNIRLFLSDHKGDTLRRVVAKTKEFMEAHPLKGAKFVLAGSNGGVMAATNEEVDRAEVPMLFWVYLSIFIFCLIIFRSIKAPLIILAPLFLVSILSKAFMKAFGLGLNINTLPVAAMAVGIGVDYSIYMYSRLMEEREKAVDFSEAAKATLNTTGAAVLFTASAKTVGVLTWLISDLKFQADMGLLMGFMYVANFAGAILLMPALVYIFDKKEVASTNI